MFKGSTFPYAYNQVNRITKKTLNGPRNLYILKKQYYEHVMKFVERFGLHPNWKRDSIMKKNPVLYYLLTRLYDNDKTYK